MSSIAYAIYLVKENRSFNQNLYNSIVSPVLALDYKPSAFGVLEIMMCIPIRTYFSHLSLYTSGVEY